MQQIVVKLSQQCQQKVENNMLIWTIILSLTALYMVLEHYQLFKFNNMEKNIDWHEIIYDSKEPNQLPCKRWGHKTVHIEDQIVLFGGFSDVTYLNDLWGYNLYTNKWRQIDTLGKKPQGKSNFTMHYDSVINQMLVFGGGGPNKRRFNKVSILNWRTKQWSQYQPYQPNNMQHFQDQLSSSTNNIPWQRTYHSSEFKYPYLITFGGEGAGNIDLDDLWVFDVVRKQWVEIPTRGENGSVGGIEGRKFHSTAMLGNEFYVISGCRSNYTCIPNIYSINLSLLFSKSAKEQSPLQNENNQQHLGNNNNTLNAWINNKQSIDQKQQLEGFVWKKHQLKEKEVELVEKWGHSSESYNGRIYMFGGRNQQDFNDIIEYDPLTSTLTKLIPQCNTTTSKLPKSRRRHSSCMLGCSMVIFGGFNLQYFNDLHHISLFPCKDTLKQSNYPLQIDGIELIELDEEIFHHFMQQISKDKPEYDIELLVQLAKHKEHVIVKSVEGMLGKKSGYFENSIRYNNERSNNPEHRTLQVMLKNLPISMMAFLIFNTFIIKDLLILPKHCNLKKLIQLLHCAQYFLTSTLTQLIENILILKVINQQHQCLQDIFNIAANFNLDRLMKVCAEKKVIGYHKGNCGEKRLNVGLSSQRVGKVKSRYVGEVLEQVRFERIHCGEKYMSKHHPGFLNNLLCQDNTTITVGKQRKKSFVQKLVQSLTKKFRPPTSPSTSPSSSTQQILHNQHQSQRHHPFLSDLEDDDQDDGVLNSNEIKT